MDRATLLPCPQCQGSGKEWLFFLSRDCHRCDGKGEVLADSLPPALRVEAVRLQRIFDRQMQPAHLRGDD